MSRRPPFTQELERDHNLCRKMLAGMAMRLHQLMTDVESYSLHSGKQRIIGYLLRELPESDHDGINVAVTLPTNKGVIASRLNLTQEHFSRHPARTDRTRPDRGRGAEDSHSERRQAAASTKAAVFADILPT